MSDDQKTTDTGDDGRSSHEEGPSSTESASREPLADAAQAVLADEASEADASREANEASEADESPTESPNEASAAGASPEATEPDEASAANASPEATESNPDPVVASLGDAKDDDAFASLPPPSRRSRVIGTALLLLGAGTVFVLMANVEQIARGTLFGLGGMLLAVLGAMGVAGMFVRDPAAISWRESSLGPRPGEPIWLAPIVAVPIAIALVVIWGASAGYAGLPTAITLALALLIPAAWRRPGLMVFTVVGFIYLPLLGTFDLWDPWETHYGEVAREIVSRDDWISLWWAQENWFWSKPIAIFWSEAFWLSALGVDVSPDANPLQPEWAIRLPVVTVSLAAVMTAFGTIKRIFGTRAGVLSALVLATVPHFFFLSHQAITDMYLVAHVVMALCMLMLAFAERPERRATSWRVGRGAWTLDLSLSHAVIGGTLLLGLPQALYLITRNFAFYPSEGFGWQEDRFLHGSAGNAGVPGNADLHDQLPHMSELWAQPVFQGLLWLLGLTLLVWQLRRQRRVQALFMTAFYVFCAVAFMGKGIPGFALPGMVALLYLIASRRWSVLFSGQLRVAPGILVIAVVGLPWYVAMYMRHGPGFTDRLLIHDHINRLAAGVHGDTGSIQYFLWQLGYATFPWVALIPAAVLGWLWYQQREARPESGAIPSPYRGGGSGASPSSQRHLHQRESLTLMGIWFFAAFTLFSAMITKFHHYIFPAVPPAALMVGVMLDRLWGEVKEGDARRERLATLGALAAPVLLVAGVGGLYGDLRGIIPESSVGTQDWVLHHGLGGAAYILIFAGAGLLAVSGRWLWRHRLGAPKDEQGSREDVSLGVAVGAGAVLLAFVGRDLSWVTAGRPQGYERLLHLFVYNYGRPWPEHFDYRPVLTGFAIVATLLVALAALRWTRMAAARALMGVALLFAAWTLNVYMVDLSPHWGMGTLFRSYYAHRSGPEEPVIAWQMNWKGENFYTGNRVHAFVDLDNEKVREWIDENRGKTVYFVFEHTRLSSFRSLVRGREIEEISTKRDNNKFVLVRIESL